MHLHARHLQKVSYFMTYRYIIDDYCIWKLTNEWVDFMLAYKNRTVLNSICTQDLSSLNIFCCTLMIIHALAFGLHLSVTNSNS